LRGNAHLPQPLSQRSQIWRHDRRDIGIDGDSRFEPSILFLTMAMFGGYRSLIGMVIATAVLESATEFLRPFGEFRMIVYGLILMLGMMFFPKGILTLGPV
jgi:ABC-type branched-subunit amino acid transport system permease subunit